MHMIYTHSVSHSVSVSKKKFDILTKEKDILKSLEDKLESEYDERKSKILDDMAKKRTEIMAESDKLAGSLVEKLTK